MGVLTLPSMYDVTGNATSKNHATVDASDNQLALHEADVTALEITYIYVTPVLILIGSLGNVVSLLLLLCTKLRYQSSSHYMVAIIVANTLCLLAVLLKWMSVFDVELYHVAGWCQFVWFIENTCVFLSVWSTVGLAIDRYVILCWFDKAGKWCNTFRVKSVVIGLSLVGTVVYMNMSLIIGVENDETGDSADNNNNIDYTKNNNNSSVNHDDVFDQPECSVLPNYSSDMKLLRVFDTAFNFIMPYTIVLVFLGFICRTYCEATREDDGTSHDSQLHTWTCAALGLFVVLRTPREVAKLTDPGGSTEVVTDYLYFASLSQHFFVLLLAHKGFSFFCCAAVKPGACCPQQRHLVSQDEDDGMALDNMVVTGRV